MRDPRSHPLSAIRSRASGAIPASHLRALDRRQGLDDRQRTFQAAAATTGRIRHRPPA